jgi:hypothetical protein
MDVIFLQNINNNYNHIQMLKKIEVILLIFCFIIFQSCEIKENKNDVDRICEFVIKLPTEPNCNALGFKIIIKDSSLEQLIKTPKNLEIKIHGAFFDDSLFTMAEPYIRLFEKDTFVLTTRSCFFDRETQTELDKIANNSLKQISITFTGNKRNWILKYQDKF